ncbi:hypothetical protein G6F60_014160 [Rhizopus arrhizus]|nr:hypothetical protein G6F60_014160 [Rhizopus arrhizus]
MLPGMDGFNVLRELRRSKQTPVIMLTARAEPIDRVLGLEMGADDYLAKPAAGQPGAVGGTPRALLALDIRPGAPPPGGPGRSRGGAVRCRVPAAAGVHRACQQGAVARAAGGAQQWPQLRGAGPRDRPAGQPGAQQAGR